MQEKITVLPDGSQEDMEPIIVKNDEMSFSLIKGETMVSIHEKRFYKLLDSLLSIVSIAEGKACVECDQVSMD